MHANIWAHVSAKVYLGGTMTLPYGSSPTLPSCSGDECWSSHCLLLTDHMSAHRLSQWSHHIPWPECLFGPGMALSLKPRPVRKAGMNSTWERVQSRSVPRIHLCLKPVCSILPMVRLNKAINEPFGLRECDLSITCT